MTVSNAPQIQQHRFSRGPEKTRKAVNEKLYGRAPLQLPKSVTLAEVIQSLPKDVFQKDMFKAWQQVVITYSAVALSMYLIHLSPWYLLPAAWFLAGTACTGLFVVGHECGHMSFARQRWLNDLVGIVSFVPSLYPFESWRIKHNHHHAHTNKLDVDNAWQPFQRDYWEQAVGVEKLVMRHAKGSFYWLASVGHQIKEHFFLSTFTPEQRPRVKFSLICVYTFAAIFFPTMLYHVGFWGVVKFWLMPFLGYHFWMSSFTLIHHTLPHLPFLPEGEWTDAEARLALTVHCEFPAWIEFLCHHINVHVPHHVSTSIPAYNLRKAHQALLDRWGPYMTTVEFSWAMLRDITTKCHIYDEDVCYVPFEQAEKADDQRPPSPKLD